MNWRRNTLPRLSGLKITYFAAKSKNQIKSIEYTSAYINDSFQRSREFKCYKVKENTEYEKQVDNSPSVGNLASSCCLQLQFEQANGR